MEGIPTLRLRFPPSTIAADTLTRGALHTVTHIGEATYFRDDLIPSQAVKLGSGTLMVCHPDQGQA